MLGYDHYASHYITLDGEDVTFTRQYDPDDNRQTASTSVVLHVREGQQLAVKPLFSLTVAGSTGKMYSSFGAILLRLT